MKENGHEVYAHDLYEEQFDPILHGSELLNGETDDLLVLEHRSQIKKAQTLITIHPNCGGNLQPY
ncbi:MAG: hypothetical protein LUQ70_05445 [Methanobacteriaceae archaeon]|nr:hypothetical protein [Methanobacteriaceae archaeon]